MFYIIDHMTHMWLIHIQLWQKISSISSVLRTNSLTMNTIFEMLWLMVSMVMMKCMTYFFRSGKNNSLSIKCIHKQVENIVMFGVFFQEWIRKHALFLLIVAIYLYITNWTLDWHTITFNFLRLSLRRIWLFFLCPFCGSSSSFSVLILEIYCFEHQ